MGARNIEIKFDTKDFFIVTLSRQETTRKKATPHALSNVELKTLRFCHK
jgi:hypothetical protein